MKNRIHFLFILMMFAVPYLSQAQNISIGVKGGISIPNLSAPNGGSTPVNTGYESRLGPDAALFAQFHISDAFSIQPMLEYSSQGGKKSGVQAFPTPAEAAIYFALQGQQAPAYLYGNYKSEVKINYLMLPILAKYEIALGESPFHIYADLGPFASYLMNAKNVTSGNSLIYLDEKGAQPLSDLGSFSFDSDSTITTSVNRFNAGVEGHLGFSYTLGKVTVFAEGGGNYGFINIQKDETYGKNNIGAVVALAGISFRLGSKSEE